MSAELRNALFEMHEAVTGLLLKNCDSLGEAIKVAQAIHEVTTEQITEATNPEPEQEPEQEQEQEPEQAPEQEPVPEPVEEPEQEDVETVVAALLGEMCDDVTAKLDKKNNKVWTTPFRRLALDDLYEMKIFRCSYPHLFKSQQKDLRERLTPVIKLRLNNQKAYKEDQARLAKNKKSAEQEEQERAEHQQQCAQYKTVKENAMALESWLNSIEREVYKVDPLCDNDIVKQYFKRFVKKNEQDPGRMIPTRIPFARDWAKQINTFRTDIRKGIASDEKRKDCDSSGSHIRNEQLKKSIAHMEQAMNKEAASIRRAIEQHAQKHARNADSARFLAEMDLKRFVREAQEAADQAAAAAKAKEEAAPAPAPTPAPTNSPTSVMVNHTADLIAEMQQATEPEPVQAPTTPIAASMSEPWFEDKNNKLFTIGKLRKSKYNARSMNAICDPSFWDESAPPVSTIYIVSKDKKNPEAKTMRKMGSKLIENYNNREWLSSFYKRIRYYVDDSCKDGKENVCIVSVSRKADARELFVGIFPAKISAKTKRVQLTMNDQTYDISRNAMHKQSAIKLVEELAAQNITKQD